MFGKSLICGALAAAAISLSFPIEALEADGLHHAGRTRYRTGYANNGRSRFDPKRNRHTGRAHENLREIARNLKRQGIAA